MVQFARELPGDGPKRLRWDYTFKEGGWGVPDDLELALNRYEGMVVHVTRENEIGEVYVCKLGKVLGWTYTPVRPGSRAGTLQAEFARGEMLTPDVGEKGRFEQWTG